MGKRNVINMHDLEYLRLDDDGKVGAMAGYFDGEVIERSHRSYSLDNM
jgi:hypothetical protein